MSYRKVTKITLKPLQSEPRRTRPRLIAVPQVAPPLPRSTSPGVGAKRGLALRCKAHRPRTPGVYYWPISRTRDTTTYHVVGEILDSRLSSKFESYALTSRPRPSTGRRSSNRENFALGASFLGTVLSKIPWSGDRPRTPVTFAESWGRGREDPQALPEAQYHEGRESLAFPRDRKPEES
jgi:hypothetical protein